MWSEWHWWGTTEKREPFEMRAITQFTVRDGLVVSGRFFAEIVPLVSNQSHATDAYPKLWRSPGRVGGTLARSGGCTRPQAGRPLADEHDGAGPDDGRDSPIGSRAGAQLWVVNGEGPE